MSIYLSILAGISAKAYDDLSDNNLLKRFKKDIRMEFLKGIHYISFTTVSIDDPLFYYFSVLANILHHLTNDEAFKNPYENSLMYSLLLLVFIINHKKITKLYLFDYLLLCLMLFFMFLEPLIAKYILENKEYCYSKLVFRIIGVIFTVLYFCIGRSKTVKYIFSYFAGYLFFSVLVQIYSLFTTYKAVASETVASETEASETVASETVASETAGKAAAASETVASETVASETACKAAVASESVDKTVEDKDIII